MTTALVLYTKCIVDRHKTLTIIDSRANGVFILVYFVNYYRIATYKKRNSRYKLTAVDRSSLPNVDSEIMLLQLTF